MRTQFSSAQLAGPALAEVERNLRACMHCGICTATCPTYVLLGDERDGPRGRIVMMQKMLEEGGAPSPETVLHVDRCLSCLSCRTACPSGVDYARLVDTARIHIETHFDRPLGERVLRWFIAEVMSRPLAVRALLSLAHLFAPIARAMPGRLGAMARKGTRLSSPARSRLADPAASFDGETIVLTGCVQAAVAPAIDDAVIRLLGRRKQRAYGVAGCCGALALHLGRKDEAIALAKQRIEECERVSPDGPITISATGCAVHMKDYAHIFQDDPAWQARAAAFAGRVQDTSRLLGDVRAEAPLRLRVAFHSACSAQNGLKLKDQVEKTLKRVGFEVLAIPEAHLCCGSAGSYSLLQPGISEALRARKLDNIRSLTPDLIATGNIGCLVQLSGADAPPVVHYAELLDWAEGGPAPAILEETIVRRGRAALPKRMPAD
jgi:glycolate oxidase iron-sulfur subunit